MKIIKKKIYDQEYDFGDTINITALSKELGVSNTPIREALSRLEVEGLVKTTMSTKVQVISLDEKEFAECAISFFVTAFGAYTLCCDNLASIFYPIVRLQHSRADYNREENLRQHEEIRDAIASGDFMKTKDLLYNHFNKHL